MSKGWFLVVWLVLTALYHGFIWPVYWLPARGAIPFLIDATVSFLVTGYLSLHIQRRRTYGSEQQRWGQVIREDEMAVIDHVVSGLRAKEKGAACQKCDGTSKCLHCKGRGWTHRPFKVAFQRDRIFLGFDALSGEEIRLQGEAVYRSTLVFGAPGSGKTKRAAHLVNRQLFRDQKGSAVYFSLKQSDADAVGKMARELGWQVHQVRRINLLNVFETWSDLTFGLKMGLKAAGYKSRESFWLDRAMMLLKMKAKEVFKTDTNPRLGIIVAQILETLTQDAKKGDNVKVDLIAISDFGGFLQDFLDPLSPCRWIFDAGPEDYIPDGDGGLSRGAMIDWSMLSNQQQLVIIPPVGASRTGVVAATALKFSIYSWFDKHKILEPDPKQRQRLSFIQDEGDNFVLASEKGGIDDAYATKTWREFGYTSWCYTQSPEFLKLAMGPEKCRAYTGVVGNTLTFALPDVEVEEFVQGLPTYEFMQRSINLNRRSSHYQDHENLLTGNLLVTRGESLSYGKGPWITGEYFQKLPPGCCVLQQAGETPRVVWIPYYDHVDIL